MTDPVSAVSSSFAQQPAQAVAVNKDYDTFLRLLTTQMKNQDPTSPTDPTQFVSQLATFTQVEQLTQMNSRMGDLGVLFAGSLARMDLGYIGMDVEAKVDGFKYDGNPVDFRYATAGAESVEIVVLDAAGEAVRTVEGSSEAGEQSFVWDGKDDGGAVAPQGSYRIEVRAKDTAGADASSVVSMRGLVHEVITEGGVSILVFGNGTAVDSSAVVGVKKPLAAAA